MSSHAPPYTATAGIPVTQPRSRLIAHGGAWLLALFVTVGAFKGASWMQFLPVDATVLAGTGVIAFAILRACDSGVPEPPTGMVAVILLGALICVSVWWSPDPVAGLDKALRFLLLTLTTLFAPLFLIRNREEFSSLMLGLAAFGILIAATAQPTGDPIKPLTVAGGNLFGQIDLGLYSAAGALAALYFALRNTGIKRLLSLLVALGLSLMVFAAASRGSLIGYSLALLYLVTMAGDRAKRPQRAALAACFVAVLLAVGPRLAGEAEARYQNQLFGASIDSILGERKYIFETAAELAVAHPMGLGAAGFPAVTQGLAYPHNVTLELGAEFGLLSIGLFALIVAAAVSAARRAASTLGRPESAVTLGLLILVLVDVQVSHDLNEVRILWLSLGLAMVLPLIAARPESAHERISPSS